MVESSPTPGCAYAAASDHAPACGGTTSSGATGQAGTPAICSPQSARESTVRVRDGAPASDFSSQHLLQEVPIERRVRHQALQPGILVLEHAQRAQLRHPRPTVLLLPDVEVASATPNCRRTSPTGVPASAWRSAQATCSFVNLDFFMRASSCRKGAGAATLLYFRTVANFSGDVSLRKPHGGGGCVGRCAGTPKTRWPAWTRASS